MKCRNIFVIVIIMITVLSCTKRDSGSRKAKPLDKEEIIAVAKEYLLEREFFLDSAKVFYDEGNLIWEEDGDQFIEQFPGEAHKVKLLEGHDYQIVGFGPQDDAIWFDLSCVLVFVDRNSGEVITSLWGKYFSSKSYMAGER